MNILDQLNSIALLEDNWNSYGAKAFSKKLIQRAVTMCGFLLDVEGLEVFPTAADSIQFEWEDDSFYIEVEVFEDKPCEIYYNAFNHAYFKEYTFYDQLVDAAAAFKSLIEAQTKANQIKPFLLEYKIKEVDYVACIQAFGLQDAKNMLTIYCEETYKEKPSSISTKEIDLGMPCVLMNKCKNT